MPSSGSGVGVPIGGGGVPGSPSKLLNPLPYTLLSLSKFAKIIQINPSHFWGATAGSLSPPVMPVFASCDSVWYQYAWQDHDKVSRFELAETIYKAEIEIANYLNYPPAPMFVAEEEHEYPRPYRRDMYGSGGDNRNFAKSVDALYGNILDVGRRGVTLVDTALVADGSLAYTDEDTDGLYETATITIASALTDMDEIKIYHTGQDAAMEWEIREVRSKKKVGGNIVIVLDSWLLIDPVLYEFFPDDTGARAIDISSTTNFVDEVDIYREYVDTTQNSALFYWRNADIGCADCGGSGCEACGQATQGGCARIFNAHNGIVSPLPASYDATNGWVTSASWDAGREPDRVYLWYYAGKTSNEYKSGRTTDPMPLELAKAIAYLSVARLDRPFCECGNVREFTDFLKTNLVQNTRDSSFFATRAVLNSPFGTRMGEVQAWELIHNLKDKRARVAVI